MKTQTAPTHPIQKTQKTNPPTTACRRSSSSALGILAACLLGMSTAACVTVNVNLPEGAVQRAADDYVRELYKAKERSKGTPEAAPSAKPAAWLVPSLVTEAWAGEEPAAVFSLQTPKAKGLQKKQKELAADVQEQKVAGVIGEAGDGFLVLKDASKLSGPKKIKVEKLISKENELRKELYEEAQGTATAPVKMETIQKSFARSFQQFSPKGTWIQDEKGDWMRKTADGQ